MSRMTLTSLEDSWTPQPGLSHQTLAAEITATIAGLREEAENEGLAVDWSTFSCTPDVNEISVDSVQGERLTYRDTTFRFGVVAARVED